MEIGLVGDARLVDDDAQHVVGLAQEIANARILVVRAGQERNQRFMVGDKHGVSAQRNVMAELRLGEDMGEQLDFDGGVALLHVAQFARYHVHQHPLIVGR